jgi:hypothetical protein
MANDKKVYSASDAQPAVLYAKRNEASELSYPILQTTDGALYIVDDTGMLIPKHDEQVIEESGAPATTTITYKLSSVTVGVKTISVTGTTTTISIAYV